jgi:hypothetical protein
MIYYVTPFQSQSIYDVVCDYAVESSTSLGRMKTKCGQKLRYGYGDINFEVRGQV